MIPIDREKQRTQMQITHAVEQADAVGANDKVRCDIGLYDLARLVELAKIGSLHLTLSKGNPCGEVRAKLCSFRDALMAAVYERIVEVCPEHRRSELFAFFTACNSEMLGRVEDMIDEIAKNAGDEA
ncbi:hypothetical protein [Tolypothrix sp. VBCCA 56010]|uniref:hypothetical protein n=1 Tax=Tolypothrix sp. VBCCA 56010 TaxID=3137731 RepID=UPI003D7DC11F